MRYVALGALVAALGSASTLAKEHCGGSDAKFYDEGLIFHLTKAGVPYRRMHGSGLCVDDKYSTQFKAAERELGISLLDSARVWYRDGSGVRSEDRASFKNRLRSGEIDADTVVFDNTAATAGDLRAGRWERPLRESWHVRFLSEGRPRADASAS